jgi:hypothetical protein
MTDPCPKCGKPWNPARVEDICLDKDCHWLKGAKQHLSPFLAERRKTHGDFKVTATISQELKYIFRQGNLNNPNPIIEEALDNIAIKLARILAGNAYVADHWDDIAGYAGLASDMARQVAAPVPMPAPTIGKMPPSEFAPGAVKRSETPTDFPRVAKADD